MKNRLVILIMLEFLFVQPVLGQAMEDSATFVDMGTGMGHVEMIGGPANFTSPTNVVSGFTTSSSSGMMFGHLFPPSHIMRQQEKLKLTEKQINLIKKEMRSFQSGIVDIQWDLNSIESKLNKELAKDIIDLEKSMSLTEKVLSAEGRLKKSHMSLLIKIRNVLSEEQIKFLRSNPRFPFGPMSMSFGTLNSAMLE